MNAKVTLRTPKGKTLVILVRQAEHDTKVIVGYSNFKYGRDRCDVMKVEAAQ